MSLSLAFACPACGTSMEGAVDAGTQAMSCPACKAVTPLPEAAEAAGDRAARVCPVCGSRDLYQQRDFNRRLGLAIAAVGLLAGPFTHWIGTGVIVGLDAVFYLLVSPVAVCYACEAQQRGFDREKGPPPFDIAVHDAYKFAKRFPPRREQAVAGPLAKRLEFEGRTR
jgi:hypothetical protein